MKRRLMLSICLFLGSFSIYAKGPKGVNLFKLVKEATRVSGVNYTIPEGFKGSLETTSKVKLTKGNVDTILSLALNNNGYARVKVNEKLYSIVSKRDIRYEATQMYTGGNSGKIDVPMTYDYFMLEYTFNNKGLTTEVVRSLRPFMSRFGRAIDVKRSNKIIIQDTGVQIHRLVKILRAVDVPKTEEEIEKEKEYIEFQRQLKLKRAESGIVDCDHKGKRH